LTNPRAFLDECKHQLACFHQTREKQGIIEGAETLIDKTARRNRENPEDLQIYGQREFWFENSKMGRLT
jgi:hypothetical protein